MRANFIDFKKSSCFVDNIHSDSFAYSLTDYGIPPNAVSVIDMLYTYFVSKVICE